MRHFWHKLINWLSKDVKRLPITDYPSNDYPAFSAGNCRLCEVWQQRLFEEIDANRAREIRLIELFMGKQHADRPVVLPKNQPIETVRLAEQQLNDTKQSQNQTALQNQIAQVNSVNPQINSSAPSEIQEYQQNFLTLTVEELDTLKEIAQGLCENALAQGLTYDFDLVLTHVIAKKERYLTSGLGFE